MATSIPSDRSASTQDQRAKRKERRERKAAEAEQLELRRNGRPKDVPSCAFEEEGSEDSDDASNNYGKGRRIMKMVVMKPDRRRKRAQRSFSIGSMIPGPL